MQKQNYKMVMNELKKQLKRLKVSYAHLSKTINIPESTLKKWFIAKDGSFNRISLICEAIGLPLEVLMKEMSEQQVLTFTMTKKQQSLFLQNRKAFNVYWLLVYERKDLEEITKLLKLNSQELKSILFKLDRFLLIQVGKLDKVKIPQMRPISWEFKGPFMEKLKEEWSEDLIKAAHLDKAYSRFILQFFQLSNNSAEEFLRDIQALEEKYARRTIMELNGNKKNLIQIRYQSVAATESFITEGRIALKTL